jgi:hypothetical protein
MTTISTLPKPVFDVCLSYLSPVEVRSFVSEDPRDEVQALVRERFNGDTELWSLWAEAYGVQARKESSPAKSSTLDPAYPWPDWSNPYQFESSKEAVTDLFRRTNEAVTDAFKMVLDREKKYHFLSRIEDPFLKRVALQREVFIYGRTPWIHLFINMENLQVIHFLMEATFPDKFLKPNRINTDGWEYDMRIRYLFKRCYESGMPFVEMYVSAGGPLNAGTLKVAFKPLVEMHMRPGGRQNAPTQKATLEQDYNDTLIPIIRMHLPYINDKELTQALQESINNLCLEFGRGLLRNNNSIETLFEGFKFLRAEAIKRGLVVKDDEYIRIARERRHDELDHKLTSLFEQVQVVAQPGGPL